MKSWSISNCDKLRSKVRCFFKSLGAKENTRDLYSHWIMTIHGPMRFSIDFKPEQRYIALNCKFDSEVPNLSVSGNGKMNLIYDYRPEKEINQVFDHIVMTFINRNRPLIIVNHDITILFNKLREVNAEKKVKVISDIIEFISNREMDKAEGCFYFYEKEVSTHPECEKLLEKVLGVTSGSRVNHKLISQHGEYDIYMFPYNERVGDNLYYVEDFKRNRLGDFRTEWDAGWFISQKKKGS